MHRIRQLYMLLMLALLMVIFPMVMAAPRGTLLMGNRRERLSVPVCRLNNGRFGYASRCGYSTRAKSRRRRK